MILHNPNYLFQKLRTVPTLRTRLHRVIAVAEILKVSCNPDYICTN